MLPNFKHVASLSHVIKLPKSDIKSGHLMRVSGRLDYIEGIPGVVYCKIGTGSEDRVKVVWMETLDSFDNKCSQAVDDI